jgi:hypothetical protein
MEKEMRAKAGRKSNRSMKAARNFAVVVAVTAILAAATAAHAVSVVVEGSTYDIVTFTGTSSSNISRFTKMEMPWYGNSSQAKAFAMAIGAQLGAPNVGMFGPHVVHALHGTLATSFAYMPAQRNSIPLGIPPADPYTDAVASTQSVPSPLPLVGMAAGFSISRRLHRRIKVSA